MKQLVVLLLWLCTTQAVPTIEDNALPTDDEVRKQLYLYRGQPEVVSMLNLPTDEDSFNSLNHLQAIFGASGVRHPPAFYAAEFSSAFPEVDARGFHESVFDGFGGYQPSWRGKRDPFGISARGFHDDVFAQDFGNFHTVKKRSARSKERPRAKREIIAVLRTVPTQETDSKTNESSKPDFKQPETSKRKESEENQPPFHKGNQIDPDRPIKRWYDARTYRLLKRIASQPSDIFTQGFGEFITMKKRRPGGDFHGDTFTQGFGDFDTMKKRRPGGDFHGDTFTQGFGDFDTMRKRRPGGDFHGDTFTQGFGDFDTMRKRRPGGDFQGDTFTQGFGDFDTMKKRRPGGDFHGDTFTQGFGDFDTMRKRRPGGDFHGDTFTQGFGDFDTMRKRRPGGDFHGDTFTHGFGDFDTMKKRRPGGDFHGDTFTQGFGDFDTMKKRRPGGDFHGDTFTQGFGDFDTMKKRRPGGDFHGDTFTQGFGDFDTMKKRQNGAELNSKQFEPILRHINLSEGMWSKNRTH